MHTCGAGLHGVGDACEMDTDGDGMMDAVDSDGDKVVDSQDVAPSDKHIQRTDFNRHMTVALTSGSTIILPKWHIKGNVCSSATTHLIAGLYDHPPYCCAGH